MTNEVRLEIDRGLARITLDRPTRLNAIDASTAAGFTDAALAATSDPDVGAILLEGTGPAFCAGGDVRAMAAGALGADSVTALARTLNRGLLALLEARQPVVAAAHGTTAGGGLGLLLCSDYAVVGAESRIGALYSAIGLTPDLSVTALLARAVGERRALQLVLSERMLTAREALDWGLVAEVAADDAEVGRRAEAIAREWLGGATEALGAAKALIRTAGGGVAAQLEREALAIGETFDSAAARARIAAFAARTGR